MNIKSTKIFALFDQYKHKKLIFVQPLGNWGDELIFKGAEKLARLAGISFESIQYDQFMNTHYSSDYILYIYGSGGFNNIWDGKAIREFTKSVSTHQGIVILGPTTFATEHVFLVDIFAKIFGNIKSEKVYIYSRGKISYEALVNIVNIVNIVPPKVNLGFDHDTALNLERKDLLEEKNSGKGVFFAIRNDKELIMIEKFKPFFYGLTLLNIQKVLKNGFLFMMGFKKLSQIAYILRF